MADNKCCLGCTERTAEPNCHTTCEKYKSYLADYHEWHDKVYKNSEVDRKYYSQSYKQRAKKRKEMERYERNK
jgi:hypothetical protein